ncbi:AaceriABL086Cp [[Ashbya] aceris (nom. inval.)]|nr:AaceriABL086Cp [[Ashbya] aceris (nom. inval.)]
MIRIPNGLLIQRGLHTVVAKPVMATSTAASRAAASRMAGAQVETGVIGSRVVPGYGRTLTRALGGQVLELDTESNGHVTGEGHVDWRRSFHGLGAKPFAAPVQEELARTLEPLDIEIKPDGLLYLPEIKYRRILNRAFGAGGWGLAPRSDTIVTGKLVTREYALVCHGQLVSVARGEQDYFNETGIPTATEGCKSNALMRCCKDLGIGSELWDPVFIKKFKKEYCVERFVEHIATKKKKKIWLRKDREVEYPYK